MSDVSQRRGDLHRGGAFKSNAPTQQALNAEADVRHKTKFKKKKK